jgi:hypothetical protein
MAADSQFITRCTHFEETENVFDGKRTLHDIEFAQQI